MRGFPNYYSRRGAFSFSVDDIKNNESKYDQVYT